jgi:hypothetical protein
MTLRELVIRHDTYQLDEWDHTATIATKLHNLTIMVANMVSKRKQRFASVYEFHPYRESKIPGIKITHENFHLLKLIAGAAIRHK